MIKLLSAEQIRNIDKRAIAELGIPGILLMENAGRSIAQKALDLLSLVQGYSKKVLIICGKGNNGGDGFVAARHLIENKMETIVVSIEREESLSGDARINHNILKHFTDIIYYDEIDIEILRQLIQESGIIVDAILGTGISSNITGTFCQIIEAINEYAENLVLSVDIPSGINAATGKVQGVGVIADYTVTFFAPKTGMLLYPGAEYVGEMQITDIGIPHTLTNEKEYNINLIDKKYISANMPQEHLLNLLKKEQSYL